MESLNIQWLEAALITGWVVSAVLVIQWLRVRARRRTHELQTTAAALTAHYDAVEQIIDDPALPLPALEFLSVFSEVVADREACGEFTDSVLRVPLDRIRGSIPKWAEEIEKIGRTRPDLEENFHKAVASGIVALFLRWPGNSWKFQMMIQQIAADRRKEALIAEQVAKIRERAHKNNGNGGPLMPGGLVPA
jgi:hypothetical protein